LWKADRATWSVPTYVTTIGLTSSGDLNIVAAAVPEPSTYAMAGVAALTAGFMAIRRRKKTTSN
jgi:hypothetical protein